MTSLEKIAHNTVTKADTKEEVKLGSLWETQNVVVIFLRRFGLAAQELTLLQPALTAANCRLVAVGLEELGLEDFIAGGFWGGELYVDAKQTTYKALGFRRMNFLQLGPALLAKVARDGYRKARGKGISGDTKGDGMQNGGLLVVSSGGAKLLLEHRQHNPADLVDNADVARVLGLDTPAATSTPLAVTCDQDSCSLSK